MPLLKRKVLRVALGTLEWAWVQNSRKWKRESMEVKAVRRQSRGGHVQEENGGAGHAVGGWWVRSWRVRRREVPRRRPRPKL